jgi:hypothetical protein
VCSNRDIPVLGAEVAVGTSSGTLLLQPVAATDDSSCTSVTYEDYDSMHSAIRGQGFCVKSTNYVMKNGTVTEHKSSLYWQCQQCEVRFTSRPVDGGGADDNCAWRVAVKPHIHGCKMENCQQDELDASTPCTSSIFQHSWQLGSVKGLVKFIEELGASGVPPRTISSPSPRHFNHRHYRGCTPTINPINHH